MGQREKYQKEAEKTTHELVEAIDKDPYNAENYYQLSTILTEMQSFTQAEELLRKALTIFDDKATQSLLHYGLGNVLYSSGLYPEAISEFQEVSDSKLQADAYLMIGQSYYAQNNYRQALAFALTASEKNSNLKDAQSLIGDCFFSLGDFKSARNYYQQVLKSDDNDVHVLFEMGIIEFIIGKREDGEQYFEKVKQIDKNYYQRMQSRLNDIQNLINSKDKQKDNNG